MGAAKIGQAHKQSGACARIHVRIGIVKQQTDAVSGVSGCASAPAHGDVSWRAKAGRAGKRGARFAAQLALVVAVYGAGCAIASVLPVRLPGNIVGMVLLLVLLGTGLLKARHVGDACRIDALRRQPRHEHHRVRRGQEHDHRGDYAYERELQRVALQKGDAAHDGHAGGNEEQRHVVQQAVAGVARVADEEA